MQIWITFTSGTGGDGIANLLEKSLQINPIDDIKIPWRIHYYVDNQPKFWAPGIDKLVCFRNNMPFLTNNNSLTHRYIELVKENLNTIVTSHDYNFELLNQSDCKDVLTKDRINVLLLPADYAHSFATGARKNLRQIQKNIKIPKIDHSLYDIVVEYNKITSDYHQFRQFTNLLNLEVSEEYYKQFCQIKNGETSFASIGTPLYTSKEYINDGIKYTQVGVVK